MTQNETLTSTLLLVVAAIVLLPVLAMAFMMPMMGMWGWGHTSDGGMWGVAGSGGSWTWLAMWLVTLLVVVGAGYLLSTRLGRDGEDASDPAIEALRLAYARGDLSDEEFERRRERLDGPE